MLAKSAAHPSSMVRMAAAVGIREKPESALELAVQSTPSPALIGLKASVVQVSCRLTAASRSYAAAVRYRAQPATRSSSTHKQPHTHAAGTLTCAFPALKSATAASRSSCERLPCSSTDRYPASDSVRCTNRTVCEAACSNRHRAQHDTVSTPQHRSQATSTA
jgi:hypothetical protein